MTTPRKALYPGTFDPITNGHYDLVRRAASLFDELVVAVADNPGKAPLFTLAQRVSLAQRVLKDIPNVTVTGYTGLTVEFARQTHAQVVIRGLRAVADFEFEFQLATMSRHLNHEVDYIFMTPVEQNHFISSTMIREIASYGGDVSQFVHPEVVKALQQRVAERKTSQ